jgi:hypothetical protein
VFAQYLLQRQSALGVSGRTAKEVDMLRLLMGPSNAVCDILRVKDEGERGMIRMLVNMMILTFVAVIVFVVVIEAI